MSWRIPNHYGGFSNADDDKAFAKKGTRCKNPSEDRVKSKPQLEGSLWQTEGSLWQRWFWEEVPPYRRNSVEERTQKWSDWDVYAQPFVPSYH